MKYPKYGFIEALVFLWGGGALLLALTPIVDLFWWIVPAGFVLLFFIGFIACIIFEESRRK